MSNVIYLAKSNRRCQQCGLNKAACNTQQQRDPVLALRLTHRCDQCHDEVESVPPRQGVGATGYQHTCDECGSPEDLASARITLPDNLGTGYIYLCSACIAAHDEPDLADQVAR